MLDRTGPAYALMLLVIVLLGAGGLMWIKRAREERRWRRRGDYASKRPWWSRGRI